MLTSVELKVAGWGWRLELTTVKLELTEVRLEDGRLELTGVGPKLTGEKLELTRVALTGIELWVRLQLGGAAGAVPVRSYGTQDVPIGRYRNSACGFNMCLVNITFTTGASNSTPPCNLNMYRWKPVKHGHNTHEPVPRARMRSPTRN